MLMVYQIGSAVTGDMNIIGLFVAVVISGSLIYMLFRPYKETAK